MIMSGNILAFFFMFSSTFFSWDSKNIYRTWFTCWELIYNVTDLICLSRQNIMWSHTPLKKSGFVCGKVSSFCARASCIFLRAVRALLFLEVFWMVYSRWSTADWKLVWDECNDLGEELGMGTFGGPLRLAPYMSAVDPVCYHAIGG